MEHEVFISYSSNDKAIANAICHVLEHHGITCWIAPRDVRPGEPYAREIISGIKNCQLMILVFTSNSNSSPHVGNEIDMAFNNGKTIIPFLIDDTPMNEELKYYLARKHWLVAYPDYEKRFEELLTAVSNVLGRKLASIDKRTETLAPKEEKVEMVYLKVLSNMDCLVLIDCEEVGIAYANTVFKISLRKGEYYVQFVSLDNQNDFITSDIKLEQDVLKKIDLKTIIKEREMRELHEQDLMPYISNGKVGYVNEKNMKIVIACIYEEAFTFVEGLARVKLNGKYGFIDKNGRQIIPCNYLSANDFCESMASVYQYNGWGFVDIKGHEIIRCQYESVEDFSEGYACVKYKGVEKYNDKWECLNNSYGYINQNGHEAFPAKFNYANSFRDGLALVEIDNGNLYEHDKKLFFIDRQGNRTIECKYDYVESFHNGLARVGLKNSWGGDFKIGYIGKSGNELIGCIYDYDYKSNESIHRFSEGLACVKMNGKYGYINQNGELIIPCEYDFALPFKNGLACVTLNGQEGCIDKSGAVVVSFEFDRISWLDEDWMAVHLKGKWSFINKVKEISTPFIYDEIIMESKGIAKVKFNNKYGFVDKFGNDTFG